MMAVRSDANGRFPAIIEIALLCALVWLGIAAGQAHKPVLHPGAPIAKQAAHRTRPVAAPPAPAETAPTPATTASPTPVAANVPVPPAGSVQPAAGDACAYADAAGPARQVTLRVTAATGLNIRAASSTDAAVVGTLATGPHTLELLGIGACWLEIRLTGTAGAALTGFISGRHVSLDASSADGDAVDAPAGDAP